jgi:hypothetical protein
MSCSRRRLRYVPPTPLAKDGVFDDSELKEFLADLTAMRRTDLG